MCGGCTFAVVLTLSIATRASAFVFRLPTALAVPRSTSIMMTANTAKPAKRATIVGGGPAGALMALYLAQDRGFEVDLFEAFEESKISGPTVRSWNIVLFERGLAALKGGLVDLQQEVSTLWLRVAASLVHIVGDCQKRAVF